MNILAWLQASLWDLDVVRVECFEGLTLGPIMRFELRDGRRLDLKLSPADLYTGPRLTHLVYDRSRQLLATCYRRCTEHEDCREHEDLGKACWQDRYGRAA